MMCMLLILRWYNSSNKSTLLVAPGRKRNGKRTRIDTDGTEIVGNEVEVVTRVMIVVDLEGNGKSTEDPDPTPAPMMMMMRMRTRGQAQMVSRTRMNLKWHLSTTVKVMAKKNNLPLHLESVVNLPRTQLTKRRGRGKARKGLEVTQDPDPDPFHHMTAQAEGPLTRSTKRRRNAGPEVGAEPKVLKELLLERLTKLYRKKKMQSSL